MKERGGERKIITYWRDIEEVRISIGEREREREREREN